MLENGRPDPNAEGCATSEETGGTKQNNLPPESPALDLYPFEQKRPTRRVDIQEHTYLKLFAARLGIVINELGSDESGAKLKSLLQEFVDNNHLAIAWYENARSQEIMRRDRFRNGSIFLLVAIPLAVAALPLISKGIDWELSGPQVAALVTAVLTAMIGTQRAVGTWLNQRQLVGVFWKASADLKENVYKLERKWEGGEIDPHAPPPALLEDLSLGIERAQEVTRTEQDAFFATYAKPTFDVGAALTSASSAAAGMWRAFAADSVKREKERFTQSRNEIEKLDTARLKVRKLEAERNAVETLIEKASTDAVRLQYQTKLTRLELDLAAAEADLSALVSG